MMGEVPLPYPVEESIPYHQCKTGSFSNTVFNVPPVTSSTTSFVKLSVVTPEPVFEDAAENSGQDNQPIIPQANDVDQPAAPLNDAEVPIPQTDLHTHREKCKKFLKCNALNGEELNHR